jgi:hypothetical protein
MRGALSIPVPIRNNALRHVDRGTNMNQGAARACLHQAAGVRHRAPGDRAVAALAAAVLAFGVVAGCSGSSGGSHSFCADQAKVQQQYRKIVDQLNPPSIDDYRGLADQLHSLANEAPAQAQADLGTMADGAQKAALTGTGFLDEPAVASAAGRLNTFITGHCF